MCLHLKTTKFFLKILKKNIEKQLFKKKIRTEAAKLVQLLESASLKKKYMIRNYEKICIE